jgi:hypothetical protein
LSERDSRYLNWLWKNKKKPVDAIVKWAKARGYKEKIRRFRAAQKWASQHQEHAGGVRSRDKFKALYWRFKAKADYLAAHPPKPATGTPTTPGSPHWGGSMSIIEQEVVPVMTARGVPITSRKRTSTLGNPSSDHYVGNTTAYAIDAGTTTGADKARAVASALGITNYNTGNYNHYLIRRSGRAFRIQILWAVSGHFDHVHVGCRLV